MTGDADDAQSPRAAAPPQDSAGHPTPPAGIGPIALYFLQLGFLGFGGMLALANIVRRDLVEERRWFSRDEYTTAFAYAQIIPGPMVTQLTITLVLFGHGVRGAVLAGAALMVGPFVIITALSAVYVALGTQPWMRAVLDGATAALIGVFIPMCWGLVTATNHLDWRLWALGAIALPLTLWGGVNLILVFLAGGALYLALTRAAAWRSRAAGVALPVIALAAPLLRWPGFEWRWDSLLGVAGASAEVGVTATGAAIFPVMEQAFVKSGHWVTDRQFLDGIALQNLTPGPPLSVAFVGYFADGVPGSIAATLGYLVPVFILTIVPAALFMRYRDNPGLQAFMKGAAATSFGSLAATLLQLTPEAITSIPTAIIFAIALAIVALTRLPIIVTLFGAGAAGWLVYAFSL
jgi:chromate transporter